MAKRKEIEWWQLHCSAIEGQQGGKVYRIKWPRGSKDEKAADCTV